MDGYRADTTSHPRYHPDLEAWTDLPAITEERHLNVEQGGSPITAHRPDPTLPSLTVGWRPGSGSSWRSLAFGASLALPSHLWPVLEVELFPENLS